MMGYGLGQSKALPLSSDADLPVFTPANIPSQFTWLSAKATPVDGFTDAGAGAISNWDDRSILNNQYAQGTAGNRPTISAANTNRSALFDGSNDLLRDATVDFSVNPCTLVAVFTPTAVAGSSDAVLFRLRGPAPDLAILADIRQNGDDIRAFFRNTGGTGSTTMSVADQLVAGETRWVIARMRASALGTCDLLTSDGSTATGNVASPEAVNAADGSVGAHANATAPYTGHLHELIGWNLFISNQQRALLASYLNSEWVIA